MKIIKLADIFRFESIGNHAAILYVLMLLLS